MPNYPDPSRRRASVDPAIQRLVAFAHLLPLVPPVALDDFRDHLLGVIAEVAVAGWEGLPLLEVFVWGSFQSQPTVQLLLRHAGADRLDFNAPLDLRSEQSDFNRRGVAQERCGARVALDHHHAMALGPGPLVDFRRGEIVPRPRSGGK